MKYHLVLMSERNKTEDSYLLRTEMNRLRNEMRSNLPKLNKKDTNNCPVLYYLYDEISLNRLFSRLHDDDEIVVHAEGFPFFVGYLSSAEYNLTAFQLASFLIKHGMPNLRLHLNILTCNSASEFKKINFARDTSRALSLFFKFNQVTVTGYTGYVVVKSNAKFSISSVSSHTRKQTHASLSDARNVYLNGNLVSAGRVMCDLSNSDFQWAANYINQTKNEQNKVASAITDSRSPKKKHSLKSNASQCFYKQNSDEKDQDPSDSSDLSPYDRTP